MSEYVIAHSGVKGMRWGVRKYQNEDGSLTPEGVARYRNELMRKDAKLTRKRDRAAYRSTNRYRVGANVRDYGLTALGTGAAFAIGGPVAAVITAASGTLVSGIIGKYNQYYQNYVGANKVVKLDTKISRVKKKIVKADRVYNKVLKNEQKAVSKEDLEKED